MKNTSIARLLPVAASALALAACGPAPPASNGASSSGGSSTDASPSSQARSDASRGLDVGQVPPDFTLPSVGGDAFTLSAQAGRRPVAIVAFRGSW